MATYVITDLCASSKRAACVAVCPVDCIYEGVSQYYVNPDECIGCGACEPECPVGAIFVEDAVPPGSTDALAEARAFFGG